MHPRHLPIDADCGLYLRKNGHGDDERFAKLFAEVWHSIPSSDRQLLVAHWVRCASEEDGRLGVSISLENLSRLRQDETVGDCANRGTELKFYARVIDLLPDNFVTYVIAHEVAHVLQVSEGKRLRPEPHPLGEAVAYALHPIEREADEIARRWGFDGGDLNGWLNTNVNWSSFPRDPY